MTCLLVCLETKHRGQPSMMTHLNSETDTAMLELCGKCTQDNDLVLHRLRASVRYHCPFRKQDLAMKIFGTEEGELNFLGDNKEWAQAEIDAQLMKHVTRVQELKSQSTARRHARDGADFGTRSVNDCKATAQ